MKPILLALSAVCLLAAAPAWALERNCDYDIRVKSDSAQIGSIAIPNGRIESNGDERRTGSGSYVGLPEWAQADARNLARRAARRCVADAVNHAGTPPSCRINDNPTDGQGAMRRYNLPNLKTVALNALCNQARMLGKGPQIANYQIYLHTLGSGDIERECKLGDDGVFAGRDLTCRDGLAVLPGQPAQQQSQRPVPQQQAQQPAQQPHSYLMTCNPGAGMIAVLNGHRLGLQGIDGRGAELIIRFVAGTRAASAGVPNGVCTWSDRGMRPDEPKALCVDSSKVGQIAFALGSTNQLTRFNAANAPYLNSFVDGKTFQVHVFNDQAKDCMRITRSGP